MRVLVRRDVKKELYDCLVGVCAWLLVCVCVWKNVWVLVHVIASTRTCHFMCHEYMCVPTYRYVHSDT